MSSSTAEFASDVTSLRRAKAFMLATPIYIWLLALVLLPNFLMIAYSFISAKGGIFSYRFTLENYIRIFTSYGTWVLMAKTLLVASASSLIAALIAYPTAIHASKLRTGKSLCVMLIVIPLWISLLMRVFSWRIILGENGVINSLLERMGIINGPIAALLYSPFAVLLTFVYMTIPFVFISVFTVVDRLPKSFTQAAADSGASPMRAFWSVTWPLSLPGLSIGLALSFLIAIGDYVTPSVVGGVNGTMVGSIIANQFGVAGNWPYGSALAVVLLLIVGIVLGIMLWAMRVRGSSEGDSIGEPPIELPGNRGAKLRRALSSSLFVLPFLFLYAPLLILVVFSFNDSVVQALPLKGFTTKWYSEMLANGPMMAALRLSLLVGFATLVVSVVFATVFALALTYGKIRFGRLAERLLMLPLGLPGVVLGLTLVLTFQLLRIQPGFFRLVLGHSTFVLPVVMAVMMDRLRRLDPALIQASLDLGATPLRTFFFVLCPFISSAIFGGALLGFTLSVDEVVASAFLVSSQPTLPVWVWNQLRFGFTPSVNAIFVCIGVVSFLLIVFSRYLINRSDQTR